MNLHPECPLLISNSIVQLHKTMPPTSGHELLVKTTPSLKHACGKLEFTGLPQQGCPTCSNHTIWISPSLANATISRPPSPITLHDSRQASLLRHQRSPKLLALRLEVQHSDGATSCYRVIGGACNYSFQSLSFWPNPNAIV